MTIHANVVWVQTTGRKIPVRVDGVVVDCDEFEVISCDAEPEKRKLTRRKSEEIFRKGGSVLFWISTMETLISVGQLLNKYDIDSIREKGVDVRVHNQ
ncbi:MAG: hypothetical protein WC461_00240 [Candidatus Paceibacterota bacterium]